MTIHLVRAHADPYFSTTDAHNGDVFVLAGKGAGMALWDLSNTAILFLGSGESATLGDTGATTIYDEGHGTHLTFTEGDGLVTIYDFQHDRTGYIQEMQTATYVGHLTPSSDGNGGTILTGVALKVHLVGDSHVTAAQHS